MKTNQNILNRLNKYRQHSTNKNKNIRILITVWLLTLPAPLESPQNSAVAIRDSLMKNTTCLLLLPKISNHHRKMGGIITYELLHTFPSIISFLPPVGGKRKNPIISKVYCNHTVTKIQIFWNYSVKRSNICKCCCCMVWSCHHIYS